MAVQGVQAYGRVITATKSDTINLDGSTTSNTTTKPIPCDCLYIGGAGIVPIVQENGVIVNVTATAGLYIPIRAIRVNSTDCTATVMSAYYYV